MSSSASDRGCCSKIAVSTPLCCRLPSRDYLCGLVLLLCFIFTVASTASSTWGSDDTVTIPTRKLHIGLWSTCVGEQCSPWHLAPADCNDKSLFADTDAKESCNLFFTTRAFMVIACIFSGLGCFALLTPPLLFESVHSPSHASGTNKWINGGIVCAGLTFVCSLIGSGSGTKWIDSGVFQRQMSGSAHGPALALGYVSWILAAAAVLTGLIVNCRHSAANSKKTADQAQRQQQAHLPPGAAW